MNECMAEIYDPGVIRTSVARLISQYHNHSKSSSSSNDSKESTCNESSCSTSKNEEQS